MTPTLAAEGQLQALLAADASPATICDRLVRDATRAGGRDNVTVALAHAA